MIGAAHPNQAANGHVETAAAPDEAVRRRWQVGLEAALQAVLVSGFPTLALLLIAASVVVIVSHLAGPPGPVDLAAIAVILIAGLRQTVLVHERGRLLEGSGRARRELEEALVQRADADSRYRVLVERVPAAVYIDVADDEVTDGGRLAYMSPQIQAILGYPPEEFIADPELWPSLIHPDDRQEAIRAYMEHWATDLPLRADYRMVAKDGSVVWVHDEAYSMIEGSATGSRRVSQGLLVDTTDQKRLEAQLVHDALHDPLTGLANRVLFRDHLERALSGRRGRRTKLAVLFLDLDDFKIVNDSFGHRAGDRVLAEIASRLTAAIRGGDVAARQSGDEFTILLHRVTGAADAVAFAERLMADLRQPIDLDGRSLSVGASVGIALAGGAEMSADDLLARADGAMYAAKARSEARLAVFDPSMRVRTRTRSESELEGL